MSVAELSFQRSHRWWMPVSILVVAIAAALAALYAPRVINPLRFPLVFVTGVLAMGLLNLWFLFLSRFTWRAKGLGVALQLAVIVALASCFTFKANGFTSDSLPELTFRWTKPADAVLPVVTKIPEAARVDLTKTTAQDFPKFLGPDGDARVVGCKLETDWKAHPPREVWRKPIGAGWSAFAVVGDYGVTQEQRGNEELVTCYDLKNGEILWTHADSGRFSEAMGGDGPRSTPTVFEGRVYVTNAFGLLHCLDGGTGKPIWTRDTLKENSAKLPVWAKSCSPLIVDDLVVVTLSEEPHAKSLAAYFRDSGKPAWVAGNDGSSYATPVVAELAGKRQIICCNDQSVSGHDIRTGAVLWELPYGGVIKKCSNPIVISPTEVLFSASYGTGTMLLKVSPKGDGFHVEKVWSAPVLMRTRYTNAVVHGGYVYGLDDGILQCADLQTGKSKWKNGRYGHGQVLLVDDLLVVQAEKGYIALVAADPKKFQELSRLNALAGKTWNTSVVAGNRLLVRNSEEAVLYELPTK